MRELITCGRWISIIAVGIYIWLHVMKYQSHHKSYTRTHAASPCLKELALKFISCVLDLLVFRSDLSCRFATTLHAAANQMNHLHMHFSRSTLWRLYQLCIITVTNCKVHVIKLIKKRLYWHTALFILQRSYIIQCPVIVYVRWMTDEKIACNNICLGQEHS